MSFNNIETTIINYLNNQASFKELEELEVWIKNPKNEKLFEEYIRLNVAIDFNIKYFQSKKVDDLIKRISKENKKIIYRKRIKSISKYAAILVIFLSFLLNFFLSIDNNKALNKGGVVLESESGDIKILELNSNLNIVDRKGKVIGSQKGNELIHEDYKLDKLVYNTLSVPFGEKFALKLSDGSTVKLNSGTTLRYPINFLRGQPREVFLVSGEAYFDINKDSLHPFIVNNKDFNIEVLGTKFNVSTYKEESESTVVLLEGAVQLSNPNISDDKNIFLEPGLKAIYNKNEMSFRVSEADIDFYTAWLSDKIVLKHMKFEKIERRLERRYNVNILNYDKTLDNEYLTATFEDESIEEVMNLINKIHPMNYKIDQNNIIIFKKSNEK